MSPRSVVAKFGVTNDKRTALIVCVEPWGDEFTLQPDEPLEILAMFDSREPRFHVRELEHGTWIWIETDGQLVDVVKNGQSLWRTA